MIEQLKSYWCATDFPSDELTRYAELRGMQDMRRGVITLAVVSLLLLLSALLSYRFLFINSENIYIFSLLSVLSGHLIFSARLIKNLQALQLLGMSLPIIAGTAFVLAANKTGAFSPSLLACVVLLFMLVPLVPWGLREACIVIGCIYSQISISTLSLSSRFELATIGLLHFLMLGSALITLVIVARNTALRKRDVQVCYDLENSHSKMKTLSYKDSLTSAWNRRFLQENYADIYNAILSQRKQLYIAVSDIDNFKPINDNHGHDYGDLVLKKLVAAFSLHAQASSYLIRLGGDEFLWVLDELNPEKLFARVMQTLKQELQAEAPDKDNHIELSVGIVTIAQGQQHELEEAYSSADKALYEAKELPQKRDGLVRLVNASEQADTGVQDSMASFNA